MKLFKGLLFSIGLSAWIVSQGWAYDLRDNAILHANQGQLFLERGQAAAAVEEYKAAILLNPYANMAASLYNNLGLAYRQTGQMPLAIASFQHACRLQPNYALFYQHLVDVYADEGQVQPALTTLKAMLQANPADAEAWFMLGLLYKESGNKKQAKAAMAQFIKLRPDSELAKTAQTAL